MYVKFTTDANNIQRQQPPKKVNLKLPCVFFYCYYPQDIGRKLK